jgi:hypothetical protein
LLTFLEQHVATNVDYPRRPRFAQYSMTILRQVLSAVFVWLVCSTQLRGELENLDKGHRVLLKHGLQIQAQAFYQPVDVGLPSYTFDPKPYLAANFTGINWHYRPIDTAFAKAHSTFPWGKWASGSTSIAAEERPYADYFVCLQFGDEQSLDDPAFRAQCKKWFGDVRPDLPNTILYTNQLAFNQTPANTAAYMRESQPDMLVMDSYRWRIGNIEGTWHLLSDLQRYRRFALLGNDGSGRRPIPYGVFTQVFHGEGKWRDPSESELRMNHFAAWALGYTVTFAFTYNYGTTALFNPPHDPTHPTATYHQLKEVNRQGRNLGPALVRLVSKDVLFVPGKHNDGGKAIDNKIPIDLPYYPQAMNTLKKDTWLVGIDSVSNLGKRNDGLPGDVLISWFQVLDESLDGAQASGEWYFMVTNGLVDPTGSAVDTRQTIRLNFAGSAPRRLQRLSRDTGRVEAVDLEATGKKDGAQRLTVTLDGGTADLFKFDTGAPFVGAPANR